MLQGSPLEVVGMSHYFLSTRFDWIQAHMLSTPMTVLPTLNFLIWYGRPVGGELSLLAAFGRVEATRLRLLGSLAILPPVAHVAGCWTGVEST